MADNGNIIGKRNVPTNTSVNGTWSPSASGIWSLFEQFNARKNKLWPFTPLVNTYSMAGSGATASVAVQEGDVVVAVGANRAAGTNLGALTNLSTAIASIGTIPVSTYVYLYQSPSTQTISTGWVSNSATNEAVIAVFRGFKTAGAAYGSLRSTTAASIPFNAVSTTIGSLIVGVAAIDSNGTTLISGISSNYTEAIKSQTLTPVLIEYKFAISASEQPGNLTLNSSDDGVTLSISIPISYI